MYNPFSSRWFSTWKNYIKFSVNNYERSFNTVVQLQFINTGKNF